MTAELIRKVRDRLSDPDRWYADPSSRRGDPGCGGALDSSGHQVNFDDPTATRWCLLGALKVEAGSALGDWPLPGAAGRAWRLLHDASGADEGSLDFNDHMTHDEVMDVIARALGRAERQHDHPTKVILSMYAGECAPLEPICLPSLEAYGSRHDYAVELVEPTPGLPASWGKVAGLREALSRYDFALWVDGDAVLLADAADLASIIRRDAFQLLAEGVHLPTYWVNAHLWGLRAEWRSEWMLAEVWARRQRPSGLSLPWELGAVLEVASQEFARPWTHVLKVHRSFCHHASYQVGDYAARANYLKGASDDRTTHNLG
jgi:hypothetical protein